jgi:hypothetical protein
MKETGKNGLHGSGTRMASGALPSNFLLTDQVAHTRVIPCFGSMKETPTRVNGFSMERILLQ